MKNKKLFVTLLSSALIISTLAACGSSKDAVLLNAAPMAQANFAAYESADSGYYPEEAPLLDYSYDSVSAKSEDYGFDNSAKASSLSESEANASVAKNRKLIKTVTMDVETLEYDNLINLLNEEVNKLGGYVESEYSSNGSIYNKTKVMKHTSITVRIPDDKLDEFVGCVSGAGSVVSKTTSAEDVTLNYVDTQSKKEMYEAEKESLTALLEKAETIEDITYLTQRLTEVRYNIESMEKTLRVYDDLVDYATVSLEIQEVEVLTPVVVEEPEPKTTGEIIRDGFKASAQEVLNDVRDAFVNLVIDLPYIIRTLVILAIIGGIIFGAIKLIIFIIKKKINKNKAKKQPVGINVEETIDRLKEINEKEDSKKTDGKSN